MASFGNNKNALFWSIFKKFSKPSVKFPGVLTKNTIVLEFFEKILKTFLEKIAKMHYLSLFLKRFKNPALIFWRLWTKNTNCCEF